MAYDSAPDTHAHIDQVRRLLRQVENDLADRAARHDASKLTAPEKEVFDRVTPRLKHLTYGSEEYRTNLQDIQVALQHHYRHNDHHPEHFFLDKGIHGMNLVQLIEMLADWKAATLRHDDGDLERSITINAERFGYGPAMAGLLRRTASYLGWL